MNLNDSPAIILADYLVDQGTFGDPTSSSLVWPLYTSSLPDGDNVPDSAASIFDSVGIKDGRLMAGTLIFHYGLQVAIRSEGYQVGWDKAGALKTVLEAVGNTSHTVGGSGGNAYTLNNASQSGPPLVVLEEGTKRRFLFFVNFMVTVTPE